MNAIFGYILGTKGESPCPQGPIRLPDAQAKDVNYSDSAALHIGGQLLVRRRNQPPHWMVEILSLSLPNYFSFN